MPAEHMMEIHLAHGTAAELQTEAQLLRLFDTFDLRPLIFTHDVVIDETAEPHDQPRLTLNTRAIGDDPSLLAAFLHEQLRWFLAGRSEATAEAAKELPQRVPDLPADPATNYIDVIVDYLEFDALQRLLGHSEARSALERHADGHAVARATLVVDHPDVIAAVVDRHGLRPPAAASPPA